MSRGPRHALDRIAAIQELSSMLASNFGLSSHMLSQTVLGRALSRRMSAVPQARVAAYLHLVRSSEVERTAFLAEVLVHETSFFRDDAVFAHLLSWLIQWFGRHEGVLRVLSAPCSTGEEAYSVAALLWRAGVPLERFSIDAVDISESAVRSTRKAVYQDFALRNVRQPSTEDFLHATSQGWQVVPELRARVSARTLNLVTPGALLQGTETPTYDLILCRNLLLYLHAAARRQALENLHGALAPDGRLILGTADWCSDVESMFELERPFETFAARPIAVPASVAVPVVEAPPAVPTMVTADATVQAAVTRTTFPVKSACSPSPQSSSPAGDEEEAHRLYLEALRAHHDGRVHEAVRIGRKALYLQPAHVPSLQLLGQIWQQAPPRVRHALRERLARMQQKPEGKGTRLA